MDDPLLADSVAPIQSHFKKRLRLERRTLCEQLGLLLATGFVLVYGGYMVYRNLAFYRFRPGARLTDLGYDLLPDAQSELWLKIVHDIPMNLVLATYALMLGFCFVESEIEDRSLRENAVELDGWVTPPFLSETQKTSVHARRKPYLVNVCRRMLVCLAIGHSLRFCTYIVTSFPGTSDNCMADRVANASPPQPTTMTEVFFTRIAYSPGNNCGDLMFSGHILQISLPVLSFSTYGRAAFQERLSARGFEIVRASLAALVAVQAVLILMNRSHYTSDVVVGAYVTPLLWHFHNNALFPYDVLPEGTKIRLRNDDTSDDEALRL